MDSFFLSLFLVCSLPNFSCTMTKSTSTEKPKKSQTNGLNLTEIVQPSLEQKMLKGINKNTCKVPINYLGNKGFFPPIYSYKAHYYH